VEIKPKIKFVTPYPRVAEMFPPVPAAKVLPDWWKRMPLDAIDGGGHRVMTAKRCPAMGEQLSQGYVFSLWTDIRITTSEADDHLSWESVWKEYDALEFFTPLASDGMPNVVGKHPWVMKFIFPWFIRATPGVSCTFLPLHYQEPDPRFTILPGTFDCDVMPAINGVCTWDLREGDETIVSGTPIMTLVPFRRTQFRTEIEVVSMDEWKYLKTVGKNSSTAARMVPGGYRAEVKRKGYPRHSV